MYFKETNIKNRVDSCYFDFLIKARKIETSIKSILIDGKTKWNWLFILPDVIMENQ